MSQLKQICKNFNIDYHIYIETDNGIKKINNNSNPHKLFIINKIINVLKGNPDKKIIYSKSIQNYNQTNNLNKNDFIYYGQFNTTDKNIKKLMLELTKGKFKFGAISQKIIKSLWISNKTITYKKFANLWLEQFEKGFIDYEELAYNQFMKKFGDKNLWFEKKSSIVKKFIQMKIL